MKQDRFTLIDMNDKRGSVRPTLMSILNPKNLQSLKDFRHLFPFIASQSTMLLIAGALFLTTTLLAVYTPKATANLVDFGLVGNQRPWFYMSICAAVIVLRILLTLVQNLIFARCTENILYGIRQWLYKILVALPMRFFDINGSGRIIARIVNDVTNLATFLSVNFFKTFSF